MDEQGDGAVIESWDVLDAADVPVVGRCKAGWRDCARPWIEGT